MRPRTSLIPSIVLGVFFALGAVFVYETLDANTIHIELSDVGPERARLRLHEGDRVLRLERRGRVEVGDDGRILGAAAGARLEVEDRDGRRLLVTGRESSEPEISYRRDGDERPFDAAARTWLADSMLVAYRRGGLDAEPRARGLLDRGVDALLDEVRRISSDEVARKYLEVTLDADLASSQRVAVLESAGEALRGDHEQSNLLRRVPATWLDAPEVTAAFARAASTIDGDYALRRALSPVLVEADDPSILDALTSVAAEKIAGDYEAAELLVDWTLRGSVVEPLPEGALRLLATLAGDYEQRRAATALVEHVGPAQSVRVLEAVSLAGDYEHAELVLAALDRHGDDSAVRAAVERSLERVGSGHETSRVQEALARFATTGE